MLKSGSRGVYKVRVDNVRKLCGFFSGQSAVAAALKVSKSYLSQIAGATPTRNIGEKLARRIERVFGLEQGYLDITH